MTPGVLVDIGNTRMKWGRVAEGAIASVSLPNDDMASWQLQFDKWPRAETWLIASVVPRATRRLSEWLAERGITAVVVDNSLF